MEAGFLIESDVYKSTEVEAISALIEQHIEEKQLQQKQTAVFAMRRFFQELPAALPGIEWAEKMEFS